LRKSGSTGNGQNGRLSTIKKTAMKPGHNILCGLAFVVLLCSLLPAAAEAQFSQQGPKLVGTGAGSAGPEQGSSVAVSADGNTAIVGGPFDNSGAGAAWVFTRAGGAWTQQMKLVGTGAIGDPGQGWSGGAFRGRQYRHPRRAF